MLFLVESFILLIACVEVVLAFFKSDSSISLRDLTEREKITTLGAITVRSTGQKRGLLDFKPGYQCEHHYADYDSILRGEYSRFATTSMKYRLPAVILEDIELNVKNIACSESTIIVEFPSSNLLAEAEREWKELSEFLVISSHAGCNGEGARAPYLVSNVNCILNSNTAILSVQRIKWSDAYDTMQVNFGTGQYNTSSLRIHKDLRKRTTSIVVVSSSETVSFPSAPSATPTSDTSIHDVGYAVPAGFELGSFSAATAGVKEKLTIKCADCSIEGSIEITQGVFTISNSTLATEKAVNFLENGFFDAVVNGLGAHIEIDTEVAGTFTESFNKTLVTLTLPGFQIPEIAAIGPMWVPTLRGSIGITTSLDFTYGFDVSVPNNSSIRLNIGNLTDSSAHGFNHTSVSALPLTISEPSIALTLSLALHSEILLGVNILDGMGSISAGAFLELPALSVSISELSKVDQDCNPSNSSSQNPHLFPNLINIIPTADIALGLQAGAQLSVSDLNFEEMVGTTATLVDTHWALQTECWSWDVGGKALVSPTVSVSVSASASGSGSGSSKGAEATGVAGGSKKAANAGGRVTVPLGRDDGGMRELYWMLGLLGSVVFVVVGL